MKKKDKFIAFSSWLVNWKKRRNKSQESTQEQASGEKLSFLAESSGFTCTPYQFSDPYTDYVHTFEGNLQELLLCVPMDEFNKDIKKRELQVMQDYEAAQLEGQWIAHRFTNQTIKTRLESQKQQYFHGMELIEETMNILELQTAREKRGV